MPAPRKQQTLKSVRRRAFRGLPELVAHLPGTIFSGAICSPRTTVDASPELAWLLVLQDVGHGLPMEVLEQMYLGVLPSGTKTWELPPEHWLFDVGEKSDFRL